MHDTNKELLYLKLKHVLKKKITYKRLISRKKYFMSYFVKMFENILLYFDFYTNVIIYKCF